MADVIAILLAFGIALLLGHRLPFNFNLFNHYQWSIVTLIGTILTLFLILDVYSPHKTPARFLNQALVIGIGLGVSAVLTTFFFFFFRNPVPRAVFILFFIFAWLFIALFRLLHNVITLKLIYWKILLVGKQAPCTEVATLIRDRPYLHSQIVGFLSDEDPLQSCGDLPLLGTTDKLLDLAFREHIDQIIVASDQVNADMMRALVECMKRTIKVTDFRTVIESISGRVPIDYLSDIWFIDDLAKIDKRYFWFTKRFFDICFSIVLLCGALPFFPLVVLLIKLDSAGPVFYSQVRVGRGGETFRVWKLRTMIRDADMNNVHWTTDNDSRITRIGKVLRKLHIDEVPQLYNVLRGEMSLIGPRPEAVSLVELYEREIPYYLNRHMVSPGVTGWAQINYFYGNSIEDTREKLKYDFYYIKNRSIVLDAVIFLRTIRTVLTGKGAL